MRDLGAVPAMAITAAYHSILHKSSVIQNFERYKTTNAFESECKFLLIRTD